MAWYEISLKILFFADQKIKFKTLLQNTLSIKGFGNPTHLEVRRSDDSKTSSKIYTISLSRRSPYHESDPIDW